jgi:hypothetical protein
MAVAKEEAEKDARYATEKLVQARAHNSVLQSQIDIFRARTGMTSNCEFQVITVTGNVFCVFWLVVWVCMCANLCVRMFFVVRMFGFMFVGICCSSLL